VTSQATQIATEPAAIAKRRTNIDVMILTFNEEKNLQYSLQSVLPWADNVFVVDSNSTDSTREIAERMGATVVTRSWLGYARQKNWALDNLPLQSDWTLIHVATRRQGLAVARGNPKRILSLADLARDGVRFVNRQGGSGTRLLFDLLLSRAGVDTRQIEGYEILEYTHAAVAAYVGSGMADAGFGLEVPARRFGLDFVPLVTERYFFLCRNEFLADPAMQQFESVLRDATFRAQVAQLPGYDPSAAGDTEPARNAFPAPVRSRRKAAVVA
jgi:molybdate-binding protein